MMSDVTIFIVHYFYIIILIPFFLMSIDDLFNLVRLVCIELLQIDFFVCFLKPWVQLCHVDVWGSSSLFVAATVALTQTFALPGQFNFDDVGTEFHWLNLENTYYRDQFYVPNRSVHTMLTYIHSCMHSFKHAHTYIHILLHVHRCKFK